jgi:hypothetical protein
MEKSSTKSRGAMIAALAVGLFGAGAPVVASAADAAKVRCQGANACKGKSACHSAANACAGQNSCKGKGWIETTEKECKDKGGKVLK